ncbi:hypothetical protein AAF712_006853 [Marasmius tenuissimus]|uniref:Uncharacterized protein n=1 Tax=Marasmius tenuissimus TaxID=585030 RepID=A0ABR2ZXG6_9AGAR
MLELQVRVLSDPIACQRLTDSPSLTDVGRLCVAIESFLTQRFNGLLQQKCDGARSICGPCERGPKDDPCEYARPRWRVLEDAVRRLEAGLREYESVFSAPLHNPGMQPPLRAPEDAIYRAAQMMRASREEMRDIREMRTIGEKTRGFMEGTNFISSLEAHTRQYENSDGSPSLAIHNPYTPSVSKLTEIARALENTISGLETCLKEDGNPDGSPSVAFHRTKLQDIISPAASADSSHRGKSMLSNSSRPISEHEDAISESIHNENEYRATPSVTHHSETIHTNSHNTNTTTNSHSHNVHITNVHHHHNKPRRWSITRFVHQIVTVCVPVFWYPHPGWHHVPHSSFGGWVNGWWDSTWSAWPRWGWHWGV